MPVPQCFTMYLDLCEIYWMQHRHSVVFFPFILWSVFVHRFYSSLSLFMHHLFSLAACLDNIWVVSIFTKLWNDVLTHIYQMHDFEHVVAIYFKFLPYTLVNVFCNLKSLGVPKHLHSTSLSSLLQKMHRTFQFFFLNHWSNVELLKMCMPPYTPCY